MTNFIYTTNQQVIETLESQGCTLLKKTDKGIYVYALSPTSTFKFEKQDNTWLSNQLTF